MEARLAVPPVDRSRETASIRASEKVDASFGESPVERSIGLGEITDIRKPDTSNAMGLREQRRTQTISGPKPNRAVAGAPA